MYYTCSGKYLQYALIMLIYLLNYEKKLFLLPFICYEYND